MNTKELVSYKKTFFASNENTLCKKINLAQFNNQKELYKLTANNVDLLENEVNTSQNILSQGCGLLAVDFNPISAEFSTIADKLKTRISKSNVILKYEGELYCLEFAKKVVRKIPKNNFDRRLMLSEITQDYKDANEQQIIFINDVTSRKYKYVSNETYKRAQSNLLYNAILLSNYSKHYKDIKKNNKYNAMVADIIKKQPQDSVGTNLLPLSMVRDFMWYLNGYRLSGVFSKLTTMELIELAKQWSFIDALNNIDIYGHNIHINPEAFSHVTKVLNACSIGFYGITFTIQMLTIFKHLIGSDDVEKSAELWDKLKYELWKRHWRLGNDGVWAIINLLTNYAEYFHLTATFANQLTAVFVLLDLVWLYRLYYATMMPFDEQISIYEEQLKTETDPNEIAFIKLQKESLELLKAKTQCTFKVYASAAVLYISGFGIALSSTAIPVVTAGFFLCTLAMALGLSENTQTISKFVYAEDHEVMYAGACMVGSLVENTLVPITFMTAYSINLPVALLCTVAYLWLKMPASNFNKADPTIEKLKLDNVDADVSTYFISEAAIPAV